MFRSDCKTVNIEESVFKSQSIGRAVQVGQWHAPSFTTFTYTCWLGIHMHHHSPIHADWAFTIIHLYKSHAGWAYACTIIYQYMLLAGHALLLYLISLFYFLGMGSKMRVDEAHVRVVELEAHGHTALVALENNRTSPSEYDASL